MPFLSPNHQRESTEGSILYCELLLLLPLVAVASAVPYANHLHLTPGTDNHDASALPVSFYRPGALPAANQQRQRTEGRILYCGLIAYIALNGPQH